MRVHLLKSTTVLFMCFVAFSVPSAPPTSIGRSNIVPTSFTLYWGQVECIHSSGNIRGYEIRYGVFGNSSTRNVSISDPNTRDLTISGLSPDTSYSVEVAGVNIIGTGQFSAPLIVDTPQRKLWNEHAVGYLEVKAWHSCSQYYCTGMSNYSFCVN